MCQLPSKFSLLFFAHWGVLSCWLLSDFLRQCEDSTDLNAHCIWHFRDLGCSCGSVSLMSCIRWVFPGATSLHYTLFTVLSSDRCVIPGVCLQTNTIRFVFTSCHWLGQRLFEGFFCSLWSLSLETGLPAVNFGKQSVSSVTVTL